MPNTGFLGWAYISGSTTSISNGLANKQVSFMSGSSILSGSSNFTYDYTSNELYLTGNLNISGTIKAENFIHKDVTEISSTGSTLFGDTADDTHVRTGSMYVTSQISSSTNVSASAFYGDGSNLSGVSASPAGATTQIQFNNAGFAGASADLTFNDTTNTLILTGTLVSTGSGAPGYIFSLSGSTHNSSYGSSVTGKYALVADDKILIDAGPSATSELSLISANGKVTIGAGGFGAAPQDIMGLRLDPSQVGSLNTIASYTGAGIDVHSVKTLSLSGSAVNITGNISAINNLSASQNMSASAYYGDGSNLTGVGGGSPDGSNTQIQFNDGGAFGASADLTYNDTTNTLAVTGTLVATGSGPNDYIFSLSGSAIDSSFGGGLIQSKYALKTNDDILIDAGDVAGVTGDIILLAKTGQVIAAGGSQTDMLVINSGGGMAGTVNTIATLDGAGIDVHSANTLSLSGSVINVSGSTRITGALDQGNNNVGNYFKLSSAYNAVQSNASGEFFQIPTSQTLTAGIVYYVSGSAVTAVTASATGLGAESFLGFSTSTSLSADGLFVRGFYTFAGSLSASISSSAANMSFAPGKQIYASSITPGGLTTVQPTGSGDVVRVLGHALDTKFMYFNPSPDFVTV
jgi:hypothetical protein